MGEEKKSNYKTDKKENYKKEKKKKKKNINGQSDYFKYTGAVIRRGS